MKVRVTLLRRNGRRVTDQRLGEAAEGTLRMHTRMVETSSYTVVELVSHTAAQSSYTRHELPPLYEPMLVTIGNEALLLRGFESAGGAGYVQEWHCTFE